MLQATKLSSFYGTGNQIVLFLVVPITDYFTIKILDKLVVGTTKNRTNWLSVLDKCNTNFRQQEFITTFWQNTVLKTKKKDKTQFMLTLMFQIHVKKNETVTRTALATPGLLIMRSPFKSWSAIDRLFLHLHSTQAQPACQARLSLSFYTQYEWISWEYFIL